MFILIDMQIAATQLGTSKTFEYRGRGRWIAGTTRIARQLIWKLKQKSWQITANLLILIMVVMILVINAIKCNFIIDKFFMPMLFLLDFFLSVSRDAKSSERGEHVLCYFPPTLCYFLVVGIFATILGLGWCFHSSVFFWLLLRLVLLWRWHGLIQFVVLGARSWNQKL